MPPVRLDPVTPRSQVKHSTTEPLHSIGFGDEVIVDRYRKQSHWSIFGGFGLRLEPFLNQRKEGIMTVEIIS